MCFIRDVQSEKKIYERSQYRDCNKKKKHLNCETLKPVYRGEKRCLMALQVDH